MLHVKYRLMYRRTRKQLSKFIDNLIGMMQGNQNFGGGIMAGGQDADGETTWHMCVLVTRKLVPLH